MSRSRIIVTTLLSLASLACTFAAQAAGDVANGNALFNANCRTCHDLARLDPAWAAANDPAYITLGIQNVPRMATPALRALTDADLADIAAYIGSLNATAAGANYQGLWWDSAESGWGINLAHQGDQIYLTWYTYDATGKASWLAMLASKSAANTYSGDLLELRGSPYTVTPYDPAARAVSVVGTGTVTFANASTGTFSYTAKSVTRTVPIVKLSLGGPVPVCTYTAAPNLAAASNVQDLWWGGPAQNGWGINLAHEGAKIYATWYTYDSDGSALWLAALLTQASPGVYTGALLRLSGPAFGPSFDAARVSSTTVGTATLTIADGNHVTWSYTIGAIGGAQPLSRLQFAAPAGTVCQ